MPWTVDDVESKKKGLNPAQKAKWVSIANGVLKDCKAKGGSDCEGKAIRIANSKFEDEIELIEMLSADLPDDVCPECINEFIEEALELIPGEDVLLATKDDKKKPGGSNAGDYKPSEGPFCGPSGGAPAGTYPVGTRKRAIAAIAYARNAPNPSGIKACVCRHWKDLAACKSGKKKQQMENVPNEALQFTDPNCFAKVVMQDEAPKLDMTIYSGGIITNHWYWGNLAIDLEGMSFPKSRYPLLEQHDITKKIGHMGKPKIVDNKLSVNPDSVQFMDTPFCQEFVKLSQGGFPYEASMYAIPSKIQRIAEDEVTEVNGMELKGPGTVWRKSTFKEGSVCVFGADSNTQSKAFAYGTGNTEVIVEGPVVTEPKTTEPEGESKTMTLDELKAGHPDVFNQVFQMGKVEIQPLLDAKVEEIKALSIENTNLKQELADQKKATRTTEANAIWGTKLVQCAIPEELHEKVRVMIDVEKYETMEAFSAAVDTEIKSWEDSLAKSKVVLGAGGSPKDPAGGEVDNTAQADEKWLTKMQSHVSRMHH